MVAVMKDRGRPGCLSYRCWLKGRPLLRVKVDPCRYNCPLKLCRPWELCRWPWQSVASYKLAPSTCCMMPPGGAATTADQSRAARMSHELYSGGGMYFFPAIQHGRWGRIKRRKGGGDP